MPPKQAFQKGFGPANLDLPTVCPYTSAVPEMDRF
jgi:hypothetical protein